MKVLYLDVDDTLYDQVQPFRMAYESMYGGKYQICIEDLFRIRTVKSNESFELQKQGKMTMKEMHIYRVQKAFEDLSILISAEEALEFQSRYAEYQNHISMTDEMTAFLDLCKKENVPLGIISNGPSQHQREKINALQLDKWICPEQMIISGDYQIAKPDLRIFQIAQERVHARAEDCIMVGDNYSGDIVGSYSAGWHPIWFNRRQEQENGRTEAEKIVRTEQEMIQYLSERLGLI